MNQAIVIREKKTYKCVKEFYSAIDTFRKKMK